MTIEQQVSNLELSKKLCELGVPQNSLFYWDEIPGGQMDVVINPEIGSFKGENYHDELAKFTSISAFTVAELGEMLPIYFWSGKEAKGMTAWAQSILINNSKEFTEKTEADARAKMLCYLLENKLITL